MTLTSIEQLFIEKTLYRRSLHNGSPTLFPATSVKKFLCNVISFTIFHLSEGGVLLEKIFLEILQNLQENTWGKVSFLIKLHTEATASDLSHVFS